MNIFIEKVENYVQWNHEGQNIKISLPNIMYGFTYGEDVMIKSKDENHVEMFSIFDITGLFVLSYQAELGKITIGTKELKIKEFISLEYSKNKGKILVLCDKTKLLIIDLDGNVLSQIVNPKDYQFYTIKRINGEIMVVCQGLIDELRDNYGRNDWNFSIDLDNFFLEKVSITQ